jgi:outer membrane protein TolC
LTLKKTLRTGGDLSVSLSNERLVSNSDFQLLSPELGSHLKVSLDQPLLRSFGLKFAVILVKVAENSHGVSVLDLHGKLSDLAQRVTEAYWDVALLKESVEAERKGLKLADEIQRQNAVRLRVGRIARVELKEAEAEVANRQAGLIVAENALELARENLRQLVHLEGERTLVPTTIEPIDSLEASTYRGSREVSLKTALEERAELRKARLEVKNRRALLQYSENQLLPSLTLEMSYGQNGLSGRPRKLRPNQPPSNAELFRGKFQDALSDALSNDFREFFTGLKLEIPFDNAAAKSAYARAHVEALQAEASYREQVSQVTIEVRKAHADVEAGGKRVDVTRLARELAGEKLADQEKRFQAGLATTRDMLRYQEDLTKARVAEMKALVDYNRSLSSLRRAEGTLLAHHKIEIIPDTLGAKPWWARF